MKIHITAIALALASITSVAQQSNANVAAQRIEVLRATVGAAPVEFSRSGEKASMPDHTMTASTLSRAEVRAETVAFNSYSSNRYFNDPKGGR